MDIRVKRAYEQPDSSDGTRVLVDRVWPRGVRRQEAELAEWLKEIAPSSDLRKWFNHDPDKWQDFMEKYCRELDGRPELVQKLVALAAKGPLTLVFAAKDREHNNAVVLRRYLQKLEDG